MLSREENTNPKYIEVPITAEFGKGESLSVQKDLTAQKIEIKKTWRSLLDQYDKEELDFNDRLKIAQHLDKLEWISPSERLQHAKDFAEREITVLERHARYLNQELSQAESNAHMAELEQNSALKRKLMRATRSMNTVQEPRIEESEVSSTKPGSFISQLSTVLSSEAAASELANTTDISPKSKPRLGLIETLQSMGPTQSQAKRKSAGKKTYLKVEKKKSTMRETQSGPDLGPKKSIWRKVGDLLRQMEPGTETTLKMPATEPLFKNDSKQSKPRSIEAIKSGSYLGPKQSLLGAKKSDSSPHKSKGRKPFHHAKTDAFNQEESLDNPSIDNCSEAVRLMDWAVEHKRQLFSRDPVILRLAEEYDHSEKDEASRGRALAEFARKAEEHFEQEKLFEDLSAFGRASASFAYQLGQATGSKIAAQIGTGIAAFTEGAAGIKKIIDTSKLIAAGGGDGLTNATALTQGGSQLLGAYNMFSGLFSDKKSAGDGGIRAAIEGMHQTLREMWDDNKKRHELTWQKLDVIYERLGEMDRRQLKRFKETLRKIDFYGENTLQAIYDLGESLHGHLWHTEDAMMSLLKLDLDARTLIIISCMKVPSHALENFVEYNSTLKTWLTLISSNPGRTGLLSAPVERETLLRNLKEAIPDITSRHPRPPLGLMVGLSVHYDRSILPEAALTQIIHPKSWSAVLQNYLLLMEWGMPSIQASQPQEIEAYYKEVESIIEKPELVMDFYANARNSKALWKGLIDDYQRSVENLQAQIKTVFEEQRRILNEQYGIDTFLNLVQLEQSASDNVKRIEASAILRKHLTQDGDPFSFLTSSPIKASDCLDIPDYWDGIVPLAETRYLSNPQVQGLLSHPEGKKRIDFVLNHVGFRLAHRFREASIHIGCHAEINNCVRNDSNALWNSREPKRAHITLSLPHKAGNTPFYDIGFLALHYPDGAVAYNVCENLLPYLYTFIQHVAWNLKPYHFPEHFIQACEAVLHEEYKTFRMSVYEDIIEERILRPARRVAADKALASINTKDFEVARLKLLAFIGLYHPEHTIDIDKGRREIYEGLGRMKITGELSTLPGLFESDWWKTRLSQDLNVVMGSMKPESIIESLVNRTNLRNLRVWQEMMFATTQLGALSLELNPAAIRRADMNRYEAKLNRGARLLEDGNQRLNNALEKLHELSQLARALVGHYGITEKTYQNMVKELYLIAPREIEEETREESFFSEDWLKISTSSFDKRGLFPLLLALKNHPENKVNIYSEIEDLLTSSGTRASALTNEQESATLRTPLHLAAALNDEALVKLLINADARMDIQDSEGASCWEYASKKLRALIKMRILCQAETTELGFSFNRTFGLFEKAAAAVDTLEENSDEEVAIIQGPTGTGKSTFINASMGVDYHEDIGDYGENIVVPNDDSIPEVAKTSSGEESETLLPAIFVLPSNDFGLIDMPGFGETRGKPELICSGVVTQLIFQQMKQIKAIVMMCSLDEIKPRFEKLRQMFENVGGLFRDLSDEEIESHVCLIITKTALDSKATVVARLQRWMESSEYADMNASSPAPKRAAFRILRALIQNPEAIHVVDVTKRASVNGVLTYLRNRPLFDNTSLTPVDTTDALTLFKQVLSSFEKLRRQLEEQVSNHQAALAHCILNAMPTDEQIDISEELSLLLEGLETTAIPEEETLKNGIKDFLSAIQIYGELVESVQAILRYWRISLTEFMPNDVICADSIYTLAQKTEEGVLALDMNIDFFEKIDVMAKRLDISCSKLSADEYETDDEDLRQLNNETAEYIRSHRISASVDDSDDEADVSLWVKTDSKPGKRVLNLPSRILGREVEFISFFADRGRKLDREVGTISTQLKLI